MRWLAVTIALLGASAALVGGIYLRDRDPSTWLPPGPTAAHHDAMAIAAAMGGTCPQECVVKQLGHPRTYHFTERIQVPATTTCVDINIVTFGTDDSHGISGVTTLRCDATAPGGAS
jgi:hypothetical protein